MHCALHDVIDIRRGVVVILCAFWHYVRVCVVYGVKVPFRNMTAW